MDFITIKNHVDTFVIDLPAKTQALVPDFVNKAIRDAGKRDYNFPHMETESALIVTQEGVRQLAAKTSLWKAVRGHAYFVSDDTGKRDEIAWSTSESDMIRRYPATSAPATSRSKPEFLLEKGNATFGTLQLFPIPDGLSDYADGDYRITVPFWTYLTDLVADADTNWWTINYPWYVIWNAAGEAMTRNRDYENATVMVGKAEKEYKQARKAAKDADLPDNMTLEFSRDQYGTKKSIRRNL